MLGKWLKLRLQLKGRGELNVGLDLCSVPVPRSGLFHDAWEAVPTRRAPRQRMLHTTQTLLKLSRFIGFFGSNTSLLISCCSWVELGPLPWGSHSSSVAQGWKSSFWHCSQLFSCYQQASNSGINPQSSLLIWFAKCWKSADFKCCHCWNQWEICFLKKCRIWVLLIVLSQWQMRTRDLCAAEATMNMCKYKFLF